MALVHNLAEQWEQERALDFNPSINNRVTAAKRQCAADLRAALDAQRCETCQHAGEPHKITIERLTTSQGQIIRASVVIDGIAPHPQIVTKDIHGWDDNAIRYACEWAIKHLTAPST